jgi:hypothetical protein
VIDVGAKAELLPRRLAKSRGENSIVVNEDDSIKYGAQPQARLELALSRPKIALGRRVSAEDSQPDGGETGQRWPLVGLT